MERAEETGALKKALEGCTGNGYAVDDSQVIPDVTTYLTPSFDRDALLFSVPVVFSRTPGREFPVDPKGLDGAVHVLIERIKEEAQKVAALAPLYGAGTKFPGRYDATIEPYTVIHSQDAIGMHLWHPDARNFADDKGVHFLVRGALPCPPTPGPNDDRQYLRDALLPLLDAMHAIIDTVPARLLERGAERSLDQKLLRERLNSLGLVAFIGDGSRSARRCTRHRSFFRVAGIKDGVNVPFTCPPGLSPLELELPVTKETVTGLGIRKREVFAVAGSNAQGKTTFLEGIIAGMDDHADGDGREMIVTVRGIETAEAMNCELAGSDVSMFFSSLPPGMSGTVGAAYGMGSGSMTMAAQVQRACARHSPLLIIDEDKAAPNLLVRSCLQGEEVTPLAELLASSRRNFNDTTLLFAACAMDTLIAQADRIMVLDRHVAGAIDRERFIAMLKDSLKKTAERL